MSHMTSPTEATTLNTVHICLSLSREYEILTAATLTTKLAKDLSWALSASTATSKDSSCLWDPITL